MTCLCHYMYHNLNNMLVCLYCIHLYIILYNCLDNTEHSVSNLALYNYYMCVYLFITTKTEIRDQWLSSLSLTEHDITVNSRVCIVHFRDGNPTNVPSRSVGHKFAARPADDSERSKRARKRGAASVPNALPNTKKHAPLLSQKVTFLPPLPLPLPL